MPDDKFIIHDVSSQARKFHDIVLCLQAKGDARCLRFADHFSPSSPRRSRAGRTKPHQRPDTGAATKRSRTSTSRATGLCVLIEFSDKQLILTRPEASLDSGDPSKPTGKTLGGRGLPPKKDQEITVEQITPTSKSPWSSRPGAQNAPSDFYLGYDSHFTLLGSQYSASSQRRAKSAPWTSTSCTSSTSRC